jgi:hypothetical protein
MLESVVISQLAYRDVGAAASWLCSVFDQRTIDYLGVSFKSRSDSVST